jgi:hypothetical protein
MNFRQNPIALAIAMALVAAQDDAAAMSGPIRFPTEPGAQPFDDAGVTLLADDWDDDGEAFLDLEMIEGGDPFEIASLGEQGVALLSAYGPNSPYGNPYGKKKKCRSSRPYGVAKLTVKVPAAKGGIIYGGGINCGKAVPKKGAYGSRACSISTCKSYGSTVDLQARALDGWQFVKWLGACRSAGSESTCSIDLNRSRKLSAKFKKAR